MHGYKDNAISCYRCSTANTIDCTDVMIQMNAIHGKDCSDVFEAQYCVKSTGLEGKIIFNVDSN